MPALQDNLKADRLHEITTGCNAGIMKTRMKSSKQSGKAKLKTAYTSPERLQKIFSALDQLFPQAQCALQHKNAFQLLVATILSAQCTDERVNKVTPGLFQKYPTPQDFAALPQPALEEEIRSTGFFRNKAKNIIGMSKKLVTEFGGQVPRTMQEMLTLPGVARKTANVVLGTAYGIPTGVVVDTHVFRIAHRLKLSNQKTPEKVEQDLLKLVPRERWISFGHQMIWFGRKVCQARKPLCADCPLESICDSRDKTISTKVEESRSREVEKSKVESKKQ
jgi:endonuclease-3